MITSQTCLMSGQLHICIHKADGQIEQYCVKNLLVNSGKDFIAQRMIDSAVAPISHMAVGSGTNAVAANNTELQSELARVPVTATRNGNKVTYSAVFDVGVGTGAITEAGLFNAATNGTMTCRSVFGVKTKDPQDVITISWDNLIEAA